MPKIVRDEHIFQTVIAVLTQRGYDSATMRAIAEAAGVSEVTLFRRYGSKAELVRQAVAWLASTLDFETAVQATGDVYADLGRVVQRYQQLMERHGAFLTVIMAELARHPEMADVMDAPRAVLWAIGGLFLHYQQAGVLVNEPPLQSAAALLGPLAYSALMRRVWQMDAPLLDVETHVRRFLEGRLQKA